MDFHLVTSTLLKDLEEDGVEFALIGGFALGLWGATRATIDMDFLLLVDDLPRAESVLARFAFRRTYKSENVAQYVSDLAPYGQIDVLLASRRISRSMLARRVFRDVQGGPRIPTLIPEDLIGLKLQASVNDSTRAAKERADIEALLQAQRVAGRTVDWKLLEEYFALFESESLFVELKERYG